MKKRTNINNSLNPALWMATGGKGGLVVVRPTVPGRGEGKGKGKEKRRKRNHSPAPLTKRKLITAFSS